jgi:hypothetical protein
MDEMIDRRSRHLVQVIFSSILVVGKGTLSYTLHQRYAKALVVRARDVRGDPSTSLGDGKTRTMGDTMGDIINIIYNIYPCIISIIISNISIVICRCDDVIIINFYRIIITSTYKII